MNAIRPCLVIPVALSWVATVGFSPLSAAEGTRLLGNSPSQLATAGAGVASPQDSSWLTLNPASLVDIKGRADASCDIISGRDTLTPQGPLGNSAAGTMHDSVLVLAPAATWVHSGEGSALAFGIYTVSGLGIELPSSRSSVAAASGNYDRRAEERFMTGSLSYARVIADGWSVGLALDLDYVDFRSDSLTNTLTSTTGSYDREHALGAGFSVSAYRRWEAWSIGAIYTSRQWTQTLRRYSDVLAGPADQPQVCQLGLAWRPLPWLEPLLDYRYINWSGVALFGSSEKGLHWRNQHIFKLGCNARVQSDLTLRAGMSYGRSPISESQVFTNGLTPLVSELHGTVGLGWRPSPVFDVQIAYLHAFDKKITDNGDDVGGLGEGTSISLVVDSVNVGVGWIF